MDPPRFRVSFLVSRKVRGRLDASHVKSCRREWRADVWSSFGRSEANVDVVFLPLPPSRWCSSRDSWFGLNACLVSSGSRLALACANARMCECTWLEYDWSQVVWRFVSGVFRSGVLGCVAACLHGLHGYAVGLQISATILSASTKKGV